MRQEQKRTDVVLRSRCRFEVGKSDTDSAQTRAHNNRIGERRDAWFGCVYHCQVMILRPIIAICGTTGVGKSDLAIELASHLSTGCLPWKGARIINADSMQVYQIGRAHV